MMKFNFKTHLSLVITGYCILSACTKMDAPYKKFLQGGEKIYSQKPDSVMVYPGHNRIKLSWLLISDPNIVKCKVYWNDGMDSVEVPVTRTAATDTVSVMINDLEERTYSFTIFTYNKLGNRSVKTDTIGEVFGANYIASLYNRLLQNCKVIGPDLKLFWYPPDSSNINTEVRYTDQSGITQSVILPADSMYSTLANWKIGTKIYFRSSYIPAKNAIDTFLTANYDSASVNFQANVEADKSLWKEARLPYDAGPGKAGTGYEWMWDGKPAAYPDVYYADGSTLPNSFTVDLGKQYDQLIRLKEWGRQAYSKSNPKDFEVWGIADTTGSLVAMSPDMPDWADSMHAKGWTLLSTVNRTDDGEPGWEANIISDPPPVRFIRVRVLSTIGGDKRTQVSELTFWCNTFVLE